jgi:hypothetical protein
MPLTLQLIVSSLTFTSLASLYRPDNQAYRWLKRWRLGRFYPHHACSSPIEVGGISAPQQQVEVHFGFQNTTGEDESY